MSAHVRRVTTTRAGGVSAPPFDTFNLGDHVGDDPAAVAANRRRLAASLGLGEDRVVWMNQVHGDRVVVVDGPVPAAVEGTDGLVTVTPRLALAVVTADCVPVLLADRAGRGVAAVHAGWRGVAAGIAGAAVRALGEDGIHPEELVAALGPAILGCCYTVGPEVLEAVGVAAIGPGKLDLHARLTSQLRGAGVAAEAIHVAPWCTRCHPGLFFSYRREGDRAGRQMAVIGPSS